ncbi:hypothetical protein EJ04DRAFT_30551 [Polyplosphaeria fusca]|uniref:Uncharacterized protein n=1 Tax=Polyplosphaeria fusca TaxID=682080 RepID=A0A9P4UW90_9PLEO|nr:hypothetical protein EJ04DRAFT_30551 [Polyplosphaeria fusca]
MPLPCDARHSRMFMLMQPSRRPRNAPCLYCSNPRSPPHRPFHPILSHAKDHERLLAMHFTPLSQAPHPSSPSSTQPSASQTPTCLPILETKPGPLVHTRDPNHPDSPTRPCLPCLDGPTNTKTVY